MGVFSPGLPIMLPFILFAFVASITPGPTNILVLSNSARFGWRAVVPLILGACTGAALLVLLVGMGVGHSLLAIPNAQRVMAWVGVLWLTWLAWKIGAGPTDSIERQNSLPMGFIGGAALQLVNPKTWFMALAVVSVFSQRSPVSYLALVFFLISLPCLGSWALMGAGSSRWLTSPWRVKWMNRVLAVLLLLAAWIGFMDSV
ncbi:Amino acid transporter LysE [Pseudomonas amygdali pv. photiniae]|nr:Amino acid transporter LysE [Pseudomonas amygdali pv. photiniae]RMO15673.1 Amino acid transporter LysE [Pseudomonas amygdali pv. morsprunorum]RMP05850.1 Amino acid transporter LysE [Pseudomonas amygdali pv. morsprunorum]RMS53957.1 Amino acid transporter LysE [Pseudomonas amygdali pv. photiniae]RMU29061.1 Amino acid transporter LysE [Pseudomonas amygdali pv. morsprunorum]